MTRRVGLALVLALTACSASSLPPPPTVEHVDLARYLGTWFEVASLPNSFQEGCVATQAEYSLRSDGDISVRNSCHQGSLDGALSTATARAWTEDTSNAKLRVQFFWPFTGDYWILKLDRDYRYALVGTPNRKYFWILSRTRVLSEKILEELLIYAATLGYDTKRAQRTLQPEDVPDAAPIS